MRKSEKDATFFIGFAGKVGKKEGGLCILNLSTARKPWKRMLIYVLTAVLACGFYYCSLHPEKNPFPRLVFINTTHSLPDGIYVAIPGKDFRNGDTVAYLPPDAVQEFVTARGWNPEGSGMTFVKHAYGPGTQYAARPGEDLQSFIVDYQASGPVSTTDGKGLPLPQHYGWFSVPEGEFLPVGTDAHSFDGRYTGTVPQDRILCRVVPLLTE